MDEEVAALALARSADHLRVLRQLAGYLVGLGVVGVLLLLYIAIQLADT